jgi:hypothetical protein
MSQPVEKEAGPPVETPVEEVPHEKKVREYKDFGHDEVKATRMLLLRSFRESAFGPDLR